MYREQVLLSRMSSRYNRTYGAITRTDEFFNKHKHMKYTILTLLITLFISCSIDDEPEIETVDYTIKNEKEIVAYLEKNELTAQKSTSGLHYIINEEGTGEQPTANSNVTVAYKGYFTDGNIFNQSDSKGFTIGLQQVIKGWTEGIPYFKEGGSGVLLIPSHLGYGSTGTSGIPGGSVLIFDVHLISVN